MSDDFYLDTLSEIVPNLRVDNYWPGHGEPRVRIEADGYIEGDGVSEEEAVRDFVFRNILDMEHFGWA